MNRPFIGKLILTFMALFTAISPYAADWNETHIYNAAWSGHAKFHNAQTMLLATALGLIGLWFLWRKARDRRLMLQVATIFISLYWVTQLGSILFPGTAFVDPEFLHKIPTINGFRPNQVILSSVLLGIIGAGYALARRKGE
jgi:hypothetical protein